MPIFNGFGAVDPATVTRINNVIASCGSFVAAEAFGWTDEAFSWWEYWSVGVLR